jgi:hypothetical protein
MEARWSGAKWRGNGVAGGTFTSGPFKIVLHTTETRGIPGYNYGKSAPHVTYYPRYRRFEQHTEFTHAARALRNESGGVQTNRDSVIQLEIVCYSQKSVADRYASTGAIWVADLTDEHLDDIRDFMLWVSNEYGVQWKWPERQAFNYAQANARGFRMAPSVWDNYNGIAAHQHVPENTHWDTGALNWAKLMAREPTEGTDEMNTLQKGDSGNAVAFYMTAYNLWVAKYQTRDPVTVGKVFGAEFEEAVKAYQKAAGVGYTVETVDGRNVKVYSGVIDGVVAFLLGRYHPSVGSAKDGTDGEDGTDGKNGLVEVRINGVIVS